MIYKTFGERLRYALEYRGLKPKDLSDRTGLSQSLISQYLSNKFEAKSDKIYVIAEALKINPAWLLLGDEADMFETINTNMISNFTNVPIYNSISCGTGLFVNDEISEYVPLPTDKLARGKEYFGQYAKGDSMINAGIIDGDIIVFEKTNVIESGKIGCFCIDENIATCKRFNKTDSSIILMPANDKHMPIVVDIMNECFRVIGKLAFVVSDRRNY